MGGFYVVHIYLCLAQIVNVGNDSEQLTVGRLDTQGPMQGHYNEFLIFFILAYFDRHFLILILAYIDKAFIVIYR